MRKEEQDIEILEKLQEEQREDSQKLNCGANTFGQERKESGESAIFTEQLAKVDAEKAELENRLSKVDDNSKIAQDEYAVILQLYTDGMTAFQNGEKGRAIELLQKGVAVDRSYYLCWLGLLQVQTENLQNFEDFEELAEIYDNCLLTMDAEKKAEVFAECAEPIAEKVAEYNLRYQQLQTEDEVVRTQNQPKYAKRYNGTKITFFILLALMLVSVTVMSISLPFYFVDKSPWLGYFALSATICAVLFFVLFFLFAILLTIVKKKKVLSTQIGSSKYGEEMRKIAQECEKYKIFVEDFAGKSE